MQKNYKSKDSEKWQDDYPKEIPDSDHSDCEEQAIEDPNETLEIEREKKENTETIEENNNER